MRKTGENSMANIAKALQEDLDWQFVSREPTGSLYLCSGTNRVVHGLDVVIHTGENGESFLVCKHCGKRFLFIRENITTATFDLSCICGATLEIEEE